MELNKSGPIPARLRRLLRGPAAVLTTAGVALAIVIASTGLSVGTLSAQAARTATLTLSPPNVTQPVGSTFTIDVLVNPGGQPVNGVGAFLDFNPAVLQVNSFTPGTAMQELSRSQSPAGTADFQAGQAPPPAPAPSTPFTLVTITFQVIGSGSTTIAFHHGGLRDTDVFSADTGDSILLTSTGAVVNQVGGGTPTGTATSAPTVTSPPTSTATTGPSLTPTATRTITATVLTNTPAPTATTGGVATLTPTTPPAPTGATVTPTFEPGVAGGKSFAVSSTAAGAVMSWRGGTLQTGYQLLKFVNGNLTILANLPANATSYVDTTATGLSCYWLNTLGITPSKTSDFECSYMGFLSGDAPREFTIRLNQTYNAQLTWLPPVGGADSYTIIEQGGGVYHFDGATTQAKLPVIQFTCYTLQAVRGGQIVGQTNGVCATPNYSNLGF